MSVARWFTFTSPKEKEKEENAYFRRVFPLGQPQQEYEKTVLEKYVHAPVSENEKMYQLLILKAALTEEDSEDTEKALKDWYNSSLLKRWQQEDRAAILALGQLSVEASREERFIEERNIAQRAAKIAEEVLPTLVKEKKYPWQRK